MDEHTRMLLTADTYIRDLFVREDELLSGFAREAEAAGLPRIQVPPELGRFLSMLVRITGARRVLEIGTLGGYSATWMARALPPEGRIITLEREPRHAEFARSFLERAGVADRVEIVLGTALDSLPRLEASGEGPFDLVFIDADKASYPDYLRWALRLTRPGGVIVGDNVWRGGSVLSPETEDARGAAEFNRIAAESPRLEALLFTNRGGQDGFLVAVVRPG